MFDPSTRLDLRVSPTGGDRLPPLAPPSPPAVPADVPTSGTAPGPLPVDAVALRQLPAAAHPVVAGPAGPNYDHEAGAAAKAMKDQVIALLHDDFGGKTPGAFLAAFQQASPVEQGRLRLAVVAAFADKHLQHWIDGDAHRTQLALDLATTLTPPDAAAGENQAAEAKIATITDWSPWPYQTILVTGYTPRDAEPAPGVHPVAKHRLEDAVKAYREGQAPFIMVSGGNVHPDGTPFYEGLEMKRELLAMGIPEEAIIVEAQARHSTTNLRNAGRFMLAHGMHRALITPAGGGLGGGRLFDQAYYYSHPVRSTFHHRCRKELGYQVGDLHRAGKGRVSFSPTADVVQRNYRDPLDP